MRRLFFWLFVTTLPLFSGCSFKVFKGSKKQFRYCVEAHPVSFNPQVLSDGLSFDASSQTLYNRIFEFKKGTAIIQPSLAESWELFNNDKSFRIQLKKNVAFHKTSYFKPTRFLNADDVIYTFEMIRNEDHPYHQSVSPYFSSTGLDRALRKIEKEDEHTLVFHLNHKDATFLVQLAMDYLSIFSKEYAETLLKRDEKELFFYRPIGTGPFKLTFYNESDQIKYKRHEAYFKGPSKIEELNFHVIENTEKRFQALAEGKCDFIKNPPLSSLSYIQSQPSLKLVESRAANVSYLAFNTKKGIFKNKLMRKIVSHALNRRLYLQQVYKNQAILAESPLPSFLWKVNMDPISYDLEKAQRAMSKLSLRKNLKVKMAVLPVARPYNPDGKLMSELIQQDLARLNIEIELKSYNWKDFLSSIARGEHDLVLYGWTADTGDPDNFLNTLLSCSAVEAGTNISNFCNLQYDYYIAKAKGVLDFSKRMKLYQRALKIFREELPWVPLAHSKIYKAMGSDVVHYIPNPLGTESFYGVEKSSWSKEK